jgi:hypothetical protein
MHRVRAAMIALLTCGAVMLIGAGTAAAQNVPMTSRTVPITGTNKGKDFKGTFKINRFEKRGNALYAVGTLRGTLKHRHVTRRGVAIPASVTQSSGAQIARTCDILHLTLGPLDLHLLGLNVHLNQVVLDITATTGQGNLLGNLLCAITGALDPGTLDQLTGQLQQLAAVLNAILAILEGL